MPSTNNQEFSRKHVLGGVCVLLASILIYVDPMSVASSLGDDFYVAYMTAGVYALTGLWLLAAAWYPEVRIGKIALLGAGTAAILGTLAGTLAERYSLCCMFIVDYERGYPAKWLRGSSSYESLPTDWDQNYPHNFSWSVREIGLVIDLAFWGCVGFIIAGIITLIVRYFADRNNRVNASI